jgi:hypothetical protein
VLTGIRANKGSSGVAGGAEAYRAAEGSERLLHRGSGSSGAGGANPRQEILGRVCEGNGNGKRRGRDGREGGRGRED